MVLKGDDKIEEVNAEIDEYTWACPNCGLINNQLSWTMEDNKEFEIKECDNCGKEYKVHFRYLMKKGDD